MNIFVFSRFRKGNILFRRISEKKRKSKKKNKKKSNESHATSTLKLVEQKTDDEPASNVENEEVDRSADLDTKRKVWADLHVAEDLIRSLIEQNFTEPTPIQKLSLPAAIQDRLDVIGAAETVNFLESMRFWNRENFSCLSIKSGKRQNFSFRTSDPNSHDQHVRKRSSKNEIGSTKCSNESRWILFDLKISCGQLTCLILTPTRELAVQIKSHIELACRYTKFKVISFSIENRKTKLFVRIASLQTAVMVGGMSTQKQERLLQQKPEIIVATPGRFWELIEEVEQTKDFSFFSSIENDEPFRFQGVEHLNDLTKIRFLAIDETDRMIEKGHFEELEKILRLLNEFEKISFFIVEAKIEPDIFSSLRFVQRPCSTTKICLLGNFDVENAR